MFAGGVLTGAIVAVSTARVGAGVGVTAGEGVTRGGVGTLEAPAVSWPLALGGVEVLGFVVAADADVLPLVVSFLLTRRDGRDVVRGRSASPPPRTARFGVLVLARATSAGVGVGRAMLSVERGVGVALATVAAGVGCAVGVGLAEAVTVRVPASLFAV
jgi:hypothetical protein